MNECPSVVFICSCWGYFICILLSSMEHLSLLLSSFDLDVVLAVLNLLYMFRNI